MFSVAVFQKSSIHKPTQAMGFSKIATLLLLLASTAISAVDASEPLEADFADPAIYKILAKHKHCSPEYLSALIHNVKPIEYDSRKHDPHKLPLPYGLFMDCGRSSLPYLVAVIPTLS